jgi:molybdopterin/thiamine biosynthesis adenylyltransferase
LVDIDIVELSNLQRQIIHSTSNLGQLKVDSTSRRLYDLNPITKVNCHPLSFSLENAADICANYDIFLDGSDNLSTRYIINGISVAT